MPQLRIAAAVITREDGYLLVVRKRGTAIFIQPGGKIEPGESAREALCRELREELGLLLPPDAPVAMGVGSAAAANEPGHTVTAEFFRCRIEAAQAAGLAVSAELEALRWIDPAAPGAVRLAELSRAFVLPRLVAAGPD